MLELCYQSLLAVLLVVVDEAGGLYRNPVSLSQANGIEEK